MYQRYRIIIGKLSKIYFNALEVQNLADCAMKMNLSIQVYVGDGESDMWAPYLTCKRVDGQISPTYHTVFMLKFDYPECNLLFSYPSNTKDELLPFAQHEAGDAQTTLLQFVGFEWTEIATYADGANRFVSV